MTSPLTTSTASPTDRWTPRLWGTLLVLCAAMFLDALDVSMVGVALPSIGSELDLSTSTLQWIVSGYILGYGGLLLLGGRTADLLGPPPGVPGGPGCLRARLAARRTRRLGPAAHRQPLHQGPERGVHRAGGPVDHHHDLRRGPTAQPRALDLHHLRRHRLLDGPRPVRPAHRGQLAPDHAAARAHRPHRPVRRPEAPPAQRAREGPQRLRHPRRRPRHRVDAAARLHRRPGTARSAGPRPVRCCPSSRSPSC